MRVGTQILIGAIVFAAPTAGKTEDSRRVSPNGQSQLISRARRSNGCAQNDIAFLIDTSGSLSDPAEFAKIKLFLKAFVDELEDVEISADPTEGTRVAGVTFNEVATSTRFGTIGEVGVLEWDFNLEGRCRGGPRGVLPEFGACPDRIGTLGATTITPGTGYTVGVPFNFPLETTTTGSGAGATIRVLSVGAAGEVLTYDVFSPGSGYAPGDILTLIDSGSGVGCQVSVESVLTTVFPSVDDAIDAIPVPGFKGTLIGAGMESLAKFLFTCDSPTSCSSSGYRGGVGGPLGKPPIVVVLTDGATQETVPDYDCTPTLVAASSTVPESEACLLNSDNTCTPTTSDYTCSDPTCTCCDDATRNVATNDCVDARTGVTCDCGVFYERRQALYETGATIHAVGVTNGAFAFDNRLLDAIRTADGLTRNFTSLDELVAGAAEAATGLLQCVPAAPPPGCLICDKDQGIKTEISSLTFEYLGPQSVDGENGQGSIGGKWDSDFPLSGDPAAPSGPLDTVSVTDKNGGAVNLPVALVSVGDEFTVEAASFPHPEFAIEAEGFTVKVHSSCSVQLKTGDVFGPYKLVNFSSASGLATCETVQTCDNTTCDICSGGAKVAALTLTYDGTNTVATLQPEGKFFAVGDAALTTPVDIIVSDSKSDTPLFVYEDVELGENITVTAGEKLPAELRLSVCPPGGSSRRSRSPRTVPSLPDEGCLATVAIHTSCSHPLTTSDHYGPFAVAAFEDTAGVTEETCSAECGQVGESVKGKKAKKPRTPKKQPKTKKQRKTQSPKSPQTKKGKKMKRAKTTAKQASFTALSGTEVSSDAIVIVGSVFGVLTVLAGLVLVRMQRSARDLPSVYNFGDTELDSSFERTTKPSGSSLPTKNQMTTALEI